MARECRLRQCSPSIAANPDSPFVPKGFDVLADRGYIKIGRDADMILLDGSPIEDMENIKSIATVWKMGIEVKLR